MDTDNKSEDLTANGTGNGSEGPGRRRRRAAVSSGNPRINVAFPFARIAVQEPSEVLCDLADDWSDDRRRLPLPRCRRPARG